MKFWSICSFFICINKIFEDLRHTSYPPPPVLMYCFGKCQLKMLCKTFSFFSWNTFFSLSFHMKMIVSWLILLHEEEFFFFFGLKTRRSIDSSFKCLLSLLRALIIKPPFYIFQVMPCKHVFCKECLYANVPSSSEPVSCPSCSDLLPVNFLSESPTSKTRIEGFSSSSILNKIQLDNFETSTKIEALVRMIAIIKLISIVFEFFIYVNGLMYEPLFG